MERRGEGSVFNIDNTLLTVTQKRKCPKLGRYARSERLGEDSSMTLLEVRFSGVSLCVPLLIFCRTELIDRFILSPHVRTL